MDSEFASRIFNRVCIAMVGSCKFNLVLFKNYLKVVLDCQEDNTTNGRWYVYIGLKPLFVHIAHILYKLYWHTVNIGFWVRI